MKLLHDATVCALSAVARCTPRLEGWLGKWASNLARHVMAQTSDNRLRGWLPQSLVLRQACPAESWRLRCPGLKDRPTMPKSAGAQDHRFQLAADRLRQP